MANNLANLKAAIGSAARANKYRLNFSVPSTVPTKSELQNADVLCKSTSFPGVTVGQIEIFNQGRKLMIPGDTTYENTWTLTFYNTEDHALRKDMISWMKSADHFQSNSHSGAPEQIMGEMSVEQLDSAGKATVRYTFHNVFVSEVAAIEIGDDQTDTIQEFDITFTFSDWVVGSGEINDPASGSGATANVLAE